VGKLDGYYARARAGDVQLSARVTAIRSGFVAILDGCAKALEASNGRLF
jgi:hypothetical protein